MLNSMITQIVNRINTYSSSVSKPVNAVEFGVSELPATPYVVVKQEKDLGGAGTAFRIITHFQPGQQKLLRSYVRITLAQALDDFAATSDTGMYNKLKQDWDALLGPIINTNDDKTISLERLYYMGDRLR